MAAEDTIKATVDELLKAIPAKNIVGDPIETEDKVIIPITKMGMGFGTGTGSGTDEKGTGNAAGGAGGGVGIFPVAVVIVFKGVSGPDGVQVVPLGAPNPLADSVARVAHTFLERLEGQWQRERAERKESHRSVEIE
jgi:uncharacterized spore protein YtfJ